MDVPRQREKQANETPVQSRDSQLPQKLLRQTCKWYNKIRFTYLNQALDPLKKKIIKYLYICHFYISAHPSKTHGDESRPELVLKLTLSSLAVSVLHIDPLPPPDAAPSPLGPMAAHFFSMVGPGQLAPAAFLQSRTVFNQACPHDHLRCIYFCCAKLYLLSYGRTGLGFECVNTWLTWVYICRFVGQGLKINYEHCQGSSLRTFSTDVSLNQVEFLECLFPSEAVIAGSQRGIQYTEVRFLNLSQTHFALHWALVD